MSILKRLLLEAYVARTIGGQTSIDWHAEVQKVLTDEPGLPSAEVEAAYTGPVSFPTPEPTLREAIQQAINKRSREAASNTPDYVLALYLMRCLTAYETAVSERDAHNGVRA